MTDALTLDPALRARIDGIAARSGRSAGEIVADALENGYSLEWQDRFLDRVTAGIEAADAGRFATADDVRRVLSKHRPS